MKKAGNAVAGVGIANLQLLQALHQLLVLIAQSGCGQFGLALGEEKVK